MGQMRKETKKTCGGKVAAVSKKQKGADAAVVADKENREHKGSLFVDTVRKYSKEEAPIRKAINECIERGILADYLRRKGSEVTNMLIAEYSYEEDMQVKQEEALRIGEKRGEKRGERRGEKRGKKRGKKEGILLSGRIFQAVKENPEYTDKQIAGDVACTVEEVKAVRKMFSI